MESYLSKVHLSGVDSYGKPATCAVRSLAEAVAWASRHGSVVVESYGWRWPDRFRPSREDDAFAAWQRRQDADAWRTKLRAVVHGAVAATQSARAA